MKIKHNKMALASVAVVVAASILSGGVAVYSSLADFNKEGVGAYASTGQNISSRAVATAEARPINGIQEYSERWYSNVNIEVPGSVKAGDYIDISYKNVGMPANMDVVFGGVKIGQTQKLPGNTNGSNMTWNAQVEDWQNMTVQNKDGYGDNVTLRVIFNVDAERYDNINFSITSQNAVNAHLRSRREFQMISEISIDGKSLVRLENTVPAMKVATPQDKDSNITGGISMEVDYKNGVFDNFRYTPWFYLDGQIFEAGDIVTIELPEDSPFRFNDGATVGRLYFGDPKIRTFNQHDVYYKLGHAFTSEKFNTETLNNGKTLKITVKENLNLEESQKGSYAMRIAGVEAVDKSPNYFDLSTNRIKNIDTDITWQRANGQVVNQKNIVNHSGVINNYSTVANAIPVSNISVTPNKNINIKECGALTIEKILVRQGVEAGAKYEISPDEILSKLPKGYEIRNPEVLKGVMGYKDIDIEVDVCKIKEIKAEIKEKTEEPKKVEAPNTGFASSQTFLLPLIGVLAAGTLIFVRKK